MPPDTTSLSQIVATPVELIALIGAMVTIVAALVGIVVAILTKLLPLWRTNRDRRSLDKRFGAELYPKSAIENAVRHYVQPDCQSIDPAGAEEPRLVFGARQKLYEAIDSILKNPTQYRYIILLADSGMGKSTFLLNYYASHLRKRSKKFKLALVPLGIPDADDKIGGLKNKKDTVLFLDALDEDTLAIVDHRDRLDDLLRLTRDFSRVLLTCRTQFFPKDEEIPSETGIVKIAPRPAGEKGQHYFHKLYLAPFTDEQVRAYLKKRFSFRQRHKRYMAMEIIARIPHLSVRPMLLTHVGDLLKLSRKIQNSSELYEEMVQAWLMREEGILEDISSEPLREFSERLAVNLYVNRTQRGAERIAKSELIDLAAQWHIPIDDWQLTGRSLLNRDAVGNHKFAHRSIMEYLFVQSLIKGEKACLGVNLTDQMQLFLWEIIEHRCTLKKPIDFEATAVDFSRFQVKFRSEPAESLGARDAKKVLEIRDFYCRKHNWTKEWSNTGGRGIAHLYHPSEISGGRIVHDFRTGLTWQRSGSSEYMNFKDAQKCVQRLNDDKYAGFSDWRLPPLEEAMSLKEPKKNEADLFIDPVFDNAQTWIWTADKKSASVAWYVGFSYGGCSIKLIDYNGYVRAVR